MVLQNELKRLYKQTKKEQALLFYLLTISNVIIVGILLPVSWR